MKPKEDFMVRVVYEKMFGRPYDGQSYLTVGKLDRNTGLPVKKKKKSRKSKKKARLY